MHIHIIKKPYKIQILQFKYVSDIKADGLSVYYSSQETKNDRLKLVDPRKLDLRQK